jgi:hypothetical protein
MFDISNISGVLNLILSVFAIPEEPITPLPPQLIIVGGTLRPGMSAKDIASKIISRQAQSGRQVGDIFTDGPNTEEAMELIRIEEILDAIQTKSVVNVAIPPGISVTVTGGNAGGPFIAQGFTTTIATGNGIQS